MTDELHDELAAALERSIEVIEFAYMNTPKQPREIEQANTVLTRYRKAKGRAMDDGRVA